MKAKMKAKAEAAKKKKVPPPGRSLIVLDVKPYEVETDLNELAKGEHVRAHGCTDGGRTGIKTIQNEGIQNWGEEYRLEDVAFGASPRVRVCVSVLTHAPGIKKLVISLVVFDDKMMVDDLIDLINAKYEDDIQSIDVAAMSKV